MLTPEEKAQLTCKLDESFATIKAFVDNSVGRESLHDVEKQLLEQLIVLGRSLLESFIAQSGTGYEADNPPRSHDDKPLSFKGIAESPYFSIFGEITIKRAAYSSEAQQYVYPIDAQLNLPEQKFSYLIQKWLMARSTETDFREAIALLSDIFGFKLSPSVAQRICAKVAPAVAPFYEQHAAPNPDTEGTHLAISADGKGVPIRKSERPKPDAQERPPKPRRGKGEKPGIKKQAVVTVDFSFDPASRTPEDIVKALLKQHTDAEREQAKKEQQQRRQEGKEQPRAARNRHVRATLEGKEQAMNNLMERIIKRDSSGEKPIIALIDGDPSLENALNQALETYHLQDRVEALILDILHVSAYVWDVGTALHGEKGNARVAWVEEKLLSILRSEVGRVIGGLRQILTKNELRPSQQVALRKAITYFDNHRHMMDYAAYLAKGYPIATGLVESACGSLVKDRMEQSGMQWSIRGAQSVLDLRAAKKNEDWEAFWPFFIKSEYNRMYADGYKMAA